MTLRKHQQDLLQVVDAIRRPDDVRTIIVHATPGAGKSALPLIAGKLIESGHADALAWICPRSALQDQGERNFLDPFFRRMLNHNLTIRSSTNEPNPCRGTRGFITTYQALGVDDNRTVLHDFERKRYILILDEFHHCELNGLWTDAVRELADRAQYRLFMSGTLARGDGKPIAFIPYREELSELGRVLRPDLSTEPGTSFIQYGRTDALREHAILPIRFQLSDGQVEWETNTGKKKAGKLSHRVVDASQALFTALSTDFADHLLRDGVNHWRQWKSNHPRAKLLVVTANFEHAKRITAVLHDMGIHAKIATSHDSPEAHANIKEFKAGLDCLVTIAMAYEGLDVPAITHIVCLTHIRTTPWIEQMVARAVRVDREAGPYRSQLAFVFAPDDILFREVVDKIRVEQLASARMAEAGEPKKNGNGDGEKEPSIRPLNGEITNTRTVHLGESAGEIPDGFIFQQPKTVKEQEEETLHRIELHVRKFSFDNRYKPQRISSEIKQQFGKSRRHMTLDELKSCLRWVRRMYPIEGRSPEFLPDGISRTRGTRQRVPTKAQPWYGE